MRVFEHGTTVALRCTERDGRSFLPMFTSESSLVGCVPDGGPWISLRGHAALGMFLNGEWDAVVIDLGSDAAYVLDRTEVKALLAAAAN